MRLTRHGELMKKPGEIRGRPKKYFEDAKNCIPDWLHCEIIISWLSLTVNIYILAVNKMLYRKLKKKKFNKLYNN